MPTISRGTRRHENSTFDRGFSSGVFVIVRGGFRPFKIGCFRSWKSETGVPRNGEFLVMLWEKGIKIGCFRSWKSETGVPRNGEFLVMLWEKGMRGWK
ncbi:hypothetical protein QE152_g10502 [Popillia japonica]|uniref:Uncharacterized protein n=1 Tax=Popillia japonica TaxID=7064 RepID=A0AAW1LRD3_POPJA